MFCVCSVCMCIRVNKPSIFEETFVQNPSHCLSQVYNEMICDLLRPNSGFLDLREDSKGNVVVAGLLEVETSSTTEVMRLLKMGNERRSCEPTAVNMTSSR